MRASLFLFASLTVACASSQPEIPCGTGAKLDEPIIVLESDRVSASALARLSDDCIDERAPDPQLSPATVLTEGQGKPIVANRVNDVLFLLNRRTLAYDEKLLAHPTKNPHADPFDADIDVHDLVWVALYSTSFIGIVDQSGDWAGKVELGALVPGGGSPGTVAIRIVGQRAYVMAQLLDGGGTAFRPGAVAVIGTEPPQSLIQIIELRGENPRGPLRQNVAHPARYDLCTTGNLVGGAREKSFSNGVEEIDTSFQTASFILNEIDLGGACLETVVVSDTEGYAIIGSLDDNAMPTTLVRFDPTAGTVNALLYFTKDFSLAGLEVDGDYVLVGDRTLDEPKIVVFDRLTGKKAASIPLSLPPLSLRKF